MILNLLSEVLTGEIPLEDFLVWLKTSSAEGLAAELDITPAEFAVGVLNYLRKYTSRYFTSANAKTEKRFLVFESKRCEIKPKPRLQQPHKERSEKGVSQGHVTSLRQKLTERLDFLTEEQFPSLAETSAPRNTRGGRGHRRQFGDSHNRNGRSNRRKPTPSEINFGSFIVAETAKAATTTTRPDANKNVQPSTSNNRRSDMPWSGRRKRAKPPTRNALLQEKLDLSKSLQKLVITKPSTSEEQSIDTIVPDECLVENRDILDKLCEIYTCFFELCLIPDLGSELCFIMSLLVVWDNESNFRCHKKAEDDAKNRDCNMVTSLFNNVHNCVYFASIVLNTQRQVLSLLDRATMDFLIQNTKIYKFHPDLYQFLTEMHSKRVEAELNEKKLPTFTGNLSSVMFVCENDAKPNFPTMASFHAFSKQRDAFYDILRIWESNNTREDWSFVESLRTMIEDLLNMHPEPTNYAHLARLFRSQLVISCVGFILDEDTEGDASPTTTLESFTRLQDRYKGFTQHVGPHRPEFPEYQEFFRCFIVTANDDKFFTHVRDSITSEISVLESTSFMALGVDDRATFVDDKTRLNYLRCAASLRILGKFLAFMVFLPYRTNTKLTEQIIASQLKARSQLAPQPDVLRYITQAANKGTLVLTIPWVVQYLALADEISLRLPYFRKVIVNLFTIYSHIGEHVSVASNIVIRLSIGWLLESHNFRRGLFLKWHSQQYEPNALSKENEKLASSNESCLDSLEMIDSRVLYFICPFLDDFKAVLASQEGPINPGFYQMTPASPASAKSPEEIQAEALAKAKDKRNKDVNEDFFRNYPESVRKVVCFIGENVASSCVRRLICGSIVSEVVEKGVAELRKVERVEDAEPFDIELYCATSTLERCEMEIYKFCSERCYVALPALMAANMLPDVETFCVGLAASQAIEKVLEWIALNINKDFFRTNLLLMAKRKRPAPRKPLGFRTSSRVNPMRKVVHLATAPAPQDTIRTLKMLVRIVTEPEKKVDLSRIETVLEMVTQTVRHRGDLIESGESSIYRLLLSLVQQLVCYRPELVEDSLLDRFQALWKMDELKVSNRDFTRVVSVRLLLKIDVLNQPKELVWNALAKYVLSLLRHAQLTPRSIETQFLATFALPDLPQGTVDEMSACVKFIIDSYRTRNKDCAGQFRKLELYAC